MSCDPRRSLITHPDAISFLRILKKRVFQQPRDFATVEESAHNSSVTDSIPDPPLSLSAAEAQFSEFLASRNYPCAVRWVFPGDVVVDKEHRYWISSNRTEGAKRAALRYEEGLNRNLGIWLRAICSTETETFASVFLPEDSLAAQYNLMGSCLKLSCPVEKNPAFITASPLRWWVYRLVNGKRSKGLWL